MRVGSCEVIALWDGVGREVAADVLVRPGVQNPWAAHVETLDAAGDLVFALGGYLVLTGDGRRIVVDAGAGTIDNGRYRGGQFIESLAAQGLSPDDVTDVVFTHLHFDHVGWATKKGEVVFPNATYRVHQADWRHFVTNPDAERGAVRKLAPLTDQLELFEGEVELAGGFVVRQMPGHTPGSSILIVGDGAQRAVLIGDLAHTPVELIEPDWRFVHDHDAVSATHARRALVAEFVDSGTFIFGAHFPELRPGVLETKSDALQWTYV